MATVLGQPFITLTCIKHTSGSRILLHTSDFLPTWARQMRDWIAWALRTKESIVRKRTRPSVRTRSLHDCSGPICTLCQNGDGAKTALHNLDMHTSGPRILVHTSGVPSTWAMQMRDWSPMCTPKYKPPSGNDPVQALQITSL